SIFFLRTAFWRHVPKRLPIFSAERTLANLVDKPIYLCSQISSNSSFLVQSSDYSTKKSKEKGKQIQKPKVDLTIDEIDGVIDPNDLTRIMKGALEHLKNDFNDNLNLRLTPSTFEQINVKTHDGMTKLGEIALVETKNANMFLIDLINSPEYVKPVLEALAKSNLNINPQVDKTTIYVPVAKVTREHRENMTKSAKLKCEQALKKMRDAESKALKKAKDAKHVSKDLIFNVNQWIKYQFELYSKEAHLVRDAKIKEILQE
ncbi:ribosome-recycling mitochondrial, partial [Brachionus plicatilis]